MTVIQIISLAWLAVFSGREIPPLPHRTSTTLPIVILHLVAHFTDRASCLEILGRITK